MAELVYRQGNYFVIQDSVSSELIFSKYAANVLIEPDGENPNLFRFYYISNYQEPTERREFHHALISDLQDIDTTPYTKVTFVQFYTTNTGISTPITPPPVIEFDFIDYTTGLVDPAYLEGRTFYDDTEKTLAYYNDDSGTKVNIGQETVFKVFNNNGANIEIGDAVRIDGNVVGGVPTVLRSIATTTENAKVSGVATHQILIGETGYITIIGKVRLDASAWSNGDILYVDSTTPGLLTSVEQPIVSKVALVVDNDSIDGAIIVASSEVEDPFAIGQSFNAPSHVQALTTTPAPLEGFTNTPFTENMTITATASGGSFRAIITPLSTAFTGFYEINAVITVESSGNVIVISEMYINGVGTGLIGRADFGNNQTDEGTLVLTAFTQSTIDETDDLEIYMYTGSGTTNITITNVVFNAKRLGTV